MKRQNNKSWFSMKKEGDSAEIMIYNDIGFFGITAESFVKELKGLGDIKNLTIRINSYGGEVFDGFAIYNRLREMSAEKTVIIDGVAASIASVIAMAGDKIKMPKNAFYMIHNPAVIIAGTSKELKVAAGLLDELKDKAVDTYMKKATDVSRDEMSEMMDEETWINAEKSVELGFADEIIDETENEEPITNRGIKLPENYKDIFLSTKKQQPSGMKTPVMKGDIMKHCPHCGKEIAEASIYCNHCGKAIDAASQPTPQPAQLTPQSAANQREINEMRIAERERIKNINIACKKHNLPAEFIQELIDSGKDYSLCVPKILDKIVPTQPIQPQQTMQIQFGVDERDKFVDHASTCLMIASGFEKDKDIIANAKKDIFVSSLHTLMRVNLEKQGISTGHLDATSLVEKTFQMIGTGSSDLPAALEATVNKSMKRGYDEAPVTFPLWTGSREVADFKTNNIVQVSNFGDLKNLPEGGDFEDAKIADSKETYSINTKGRKYTISRNALVNDDMDVFSRIPMIMGRAVGRRINKDVYDELASNSLAGPAMNDSNYLFDSTNHSNVVATSGVVSVSSLSASDKLLLEMPLLKPEPDSQTQYQSVTGRYIVTGTSNRVSILQVLGSGMDISKSIVGVLNPFTLSNLTPVFDPYLQALLTAGSKSNAWYHVADQMESETMGVAYLRGQTTPTMRRDVSRVGMALGILFDIYMDWGIYTADWRGIIYNDGAS